MYELCALDHAFKGHGLMGVMYRIVEGEVPDLPTVYSEDLNTVFKKRANTLRAPALYIMNDTLHTSLMAYYSVLLFTPMASSVTTCFFVILSFVVFNSLMPMFILGV